MNNMFRGVIAGILVGAGATVWAMNNLTGAQKRKLSRLASDTVAKVAKGCEFLGH